MTTTGIETMKSAFQAAKLIVAGLAAGEADRPDVVEARKTELSALKKDELVARILELEKPKADKGISVVDVITKIMTDPACTALNHEQVAACVHMALPEAKTTGKSVASIVCKQGKDLGFLPRERVKLDLASLLA